MFSTAASSLKPHFWRTPIKYCRWAAHEKPSLFFAVVLGVSGPVILLVSTPIRKYYGIKPPPQIPYTYPVPTGPRKIPEGYDD